MTPSEIFQKKIKEASDELMFAQMVCNHVGFLNKTHHDQSDGYACGPEYVTHFECANCGKFWVEQGSV